MINLNINSLNGLYSPLSANLYKSTSALATAMERLSTGCKINSAKDDAARLHLSEKLQSNIRAKSQGCDNIQEGLSALSIAQGSFSSAREIVQRLMTLANQASNGVYGSAERDMLQLEADELVKNLRQIRNSTEYADKKILQGGDVISSGNVQSVERISEDEALARGYIVIKSYDDFINKIHGWGAGTAGQTYILMNDIDMSSVTSYIKRSSFQGTLDGNGYTISNFHYSTTDTRFGLFGSISSTGEVKNLTLSNFDITGAHGTGALVGQAESGAKITNCSVVNSELHSTTFWLGGLVGMSDGAIIENCSVEANLDGLNSVGGIVGQFSGAGTQLINSSFEGNISGDSVGGIVSDTRNYGGLISGCSSSANINSVSHSGGIFREADEGNVLTVENSFFNGSIANVSGRSSGIAANLASNTQIINSYSSGQIISTSNSGGFSGEDSGVYSGCFWNEDLTELTTDVGPSDNVNIQALSTEEMLDPKTYINAGWDEDVWVLEDGSLPHFAWQNTRSEIELQLDAGSDEHNIFNLDASMDVFVSSIDFSSAQGARDTMANLQDYMDSLLHKESKIGASFNVLSAMKERQDSTIASLVGSRSSIMDADYAVETADLLRNQLLQQSSINLMKQMRQANRDIILNLLKT